MNTLFKFIFSISCLRPITRALAVILMLLLSYMNGFLNGAFPSNDEQHQTINDVAHDSYWCHYVELFCRRDDSRQTREPPRNEAVLEPNFDWTRFNPHSGIAAISLGIAELNSGLKPKIPENIAESTPAIAKFGSGIVTENPAIFTEIPVNRSLSPKTSTEQRRVIKFGDALMTQHENMNCSGLEMREGAWYEN
ncbi:hypothetical protein [Shewanella japonica]|uniref:hypothetical protein n=1 Tax=Shewanella japonica TaxID=93973 RepID=UPI000E70CEF2|nr:hypothetical protein [Shewanella japonica]